MLKNFILILCCTIILTLWLSACQSVPGFNLFSSTLEPDKAAPHSNFVGAQQVLLAQVGQPLALESHHVGTTALARVEIAINGQPLRSEATAGQANVFPENLAVTQALARLGQAAVPQPLSFPSPMCQNLAQSGGMLPAGSVPVDIFTTTWTVCHVWIGQVPGTYDLSVKAVDKENRPGEAVVQRIEVK
jgi:hypothetical protein